MLNKETGMYESIIERKERLTKETVKEINRRIEELFAKPIEHIFPDEYGKEPSEP